MVKRALRRLGFSPRQQLWLLLAGALGVLWLAAAWDYRRTEDESVAQIRQQTGALALAFAEHAESAFQRIDHALLQLREAWLARPDAMADAISHQQGLLSNTIIQVAVIDAEGYLAYSNLAPAGERIFLGDREHFKTHEAADADRLFVSRPVKGRVSGKWSIQLTRPIFDQRRFAGVMVLSVDPAYFVSFYRKIDLGSQGLAVLVRDSGEIMARSVGQEQYIGRVLTSPYFASPSAPPQSSFRRFSPLDNVDRFMGYYRLPARAVTVLVGAGAEETLAPARNHQRTVLAMTAVVTLLLLFITLQILRGITQREKARVRLQLAASVFTHAREGIIITDADGTIVDVNDIFTDITGYSREEVIGRNPRMFASGRQPAELYAAMWKALAEKGHWYGELWNRRKDGEMYAEMINIGTVRDDSGAIRNYVALITDITKSKEHQKQLEHAAHYDALTGLPNRVLFGDRLQQALTQTRRRGKQLAVAYLDLDGFKAVNDNHGHDVGDELLIAVAQRMKTALREGDTLGRVGGDEFVAVMADLEHPQDCEPVLTRLLQAAADPVTVGKAALHVSASIGVTLYPRDGVDPDQLLRRADQAMYLAKQTGRNCYHLFDIDRDTAVQTQHEALECIRHAFEQGEFVLHYQPKVNMRTGEVVGAEAQIRWQDPERGLLQPAAFLPVIEDHELAVELGEWVIDTALTQMAAWLTQGLDVPVSVNICARQLQQEDFVQRLRELLVAHPDVQPHRLELEVLETSALEDMAHVSAVMHACREIGVTFALDDFGTGYSSLTYLKRLPVDTLKIDQSFVRHMLDDREDLAIVEGVLGMATVFRRSVIAEGVETVAHGELLLPLGCELAQGYAIARSMPGTTFPGWVAAWRPHPAWTAWRERTPNRDDRVAVFAAVEHRQWIRAIEAPPPHSHDCHFGKWLETEGQIRYGEHPDFPQLTATHDRVHVLGRERIELHAVEPQTDARARLDEMQALSDKMIARLKAMCGRAERRHYLV